MSENELLGDMHIGLLGGSFNPVHLGHLVMAQDALEEHELDRVLFVPTAHPPHKDSNALAPSDHRRAMLEAALEGDPSFEVSTVELDREGVSYSIDTVRALQELHPAARFSFIIGSDTLFELHTWKRIYSLLARCEFITMCRPGFREQEITSETLNLQEPWPERLRQSLTVGHLVDVSSSDIRMRVAEGLSIRYLVSEVVEMYIAEHHLYRT
jgi:nicotinate-nucleotide adenylyltransferase